MKITGIVRYCDYLREMQDFYELLGLEFEPDGTGLVTQVGDTRLYLLSRPLSHYGSSNASGVNSMITFEVDDLEEIEIRLLANRALCSLEEYVLQVQDPEGGLVLLEQQENG